MPNKARDSPFEFSHILYTDMQFTCSCCTIIIQHFIQLSEISSQRDSSIAEGTGGSGNGVFGMRTDWSVSRPLTPYSENPDEPNSEILLQWLPA